jgi:hypothetical protein
MGTAAHCLQLLLVPRSLRALVRIVAVGLVQGYAKLKKPSHFPYGQFLPTDTQPFRLQLHS